MSNLDGQVAATALLDENGHNASDYELKHILSVASAYLDIGQVEDAADLLLEAKDVGGDHPDVVALERRLDHIGGRSTSSAQAGSLPVKPDVLLHFTAPLPGVESLPAPLQQLTRATERHFKSQQMYSALDLAQTVSAQAPGYLPGYVRLAEIQIALGNVTQARELLGTLQQWYDITGEAPDPIVQSLSIALNPEDTSALIEYAMSLVTSGNTSALEPFVPEAISRAVSLNPAGARDLAEAYLELQPDDEETLRLYLRVVAAMEDADQLVDAARLRVKRTSAPDLIMYRMVAEAIAEDGDWLPWIEALVLSLRAQPDAYAHTEEQLFAARQVLSPAHFSLAASLIALASEQWSTALDALSYALLPDHPGSIEAFIASYARAIALEHLEDPAAGTALLDAAQRAYHPDIEPFATSTRLFGVSAAPGDLLRAFSDHDNRGSSLAALQALRDADPTRLDVRAALADAYMAAGDTRASIRELRDIAEECEKAGNLAGMTDAMRKISQAVPTNIDMKATLIEGYLRRGVLAEAVDELDAIGALYVDRGRTAEAVSAYTRAAEIAAALGDFKRGDSLFDRAVEADPDDVPVRHAAVAFHLQTGAIEKATTHLREVVRIALALNDLDEAVAALHQIIALAQDDPDAYHKLGEVLTSLGEYTQAERVYRRLASFTPYDPVLEAKQSALAVLAATK